MADVGSSEKVTGKESGAWRSQLERHNVDKSDYTWEEVSLEFAMDYLSFPRTRRTMERGRMSEKAQERLQQHLRKISSCGPWEEKVRNEADLALAEMGPISPRLIARYLHGDQIDRIAITFGLTRNGKGNRTNELLAVISGKHRLANTDTAGFLGVEALQYKLGDKIATVIHDLPRYRYDHVGGSTIPGPMNVYLMQFVPVGERGSKLQRVEIPVERADKIKGWKGLCDTIECVESAKNRLINIIDRTVSKRYPPVLNY